ncbi:hypothetical protein U1Q18_001495, partial [Sarracenia purpurea var. burkii]
MVLKGYRVEYDRENDLNPWGTKLAAVRKVFHNLAATTMQVCSRDLEAVTERKGLKGRSRDDGGYEGRGRGDGGHGGGAPFSGGMEALVAETVRLEEE